MDIAIVGIGCRYPGGADSPAEFWRLLSGGVDAVSEVPAERFDVESLFDPDPGKPGKLFSRWGGFVEAIDRFDAGFFGISPREAQRIDPQHRMLLEASWEALEDAGLPADRLSGTPTGVFVGIATSDYGRLQLDSSNQGNVDTYALLGTAGSVAANRISFHFDLRGPSMAVDTACSSSLVAVHLACRSLASGESDLVLAGGVNAFLTAEPVIGFCKAGMLSPDGRCKAFDARANGYVRAEGVGVLVLKPLSAALAGGDPIHAVIRGSATNQDGHTVGITVPRAEAQRDLMRAALADAGIGPADVQYVEAHGTGTPVGDPLEARAIGAAFGPARPDGPPLLIGSVKTNLGHLEAAAGVAGVIKAALALEHRQIPPHLHLKEVNPEIGLEELRLRIPTELEPWPSTTGPARAGVNSFGFGGANAHVVLEEPPRIECALDRGDRARLLTISARCRAALEELTERYRDRLRDDDTLSFADACYTAALHRTHHSHRLAIVAGCRQECVDRLDEVLAGGTETAGATGTVAQGAPPKLAFVFTGMGPLWWGMGRQLMRAEPVYREAIEECDRLLRPLAPWSLLDELAAGETDSRVNEPDRAQVVNLAVHVALAALWRSWGIEPDAVVGHSAGELGAACVAGALSLRDALHIAYHRGRLQQRASGTGTMLAVALSERDARELIARHEGLLSLAAVNSPSSVTLSGAAEALERVAGELEHRDVFARPLPVTVPYHGPEMDPIRDELLASLTEVAPRPARVPMVSVVTGDWVDGEDLDAGYWWRNVRRPVRFADAVSRLADDGYTAFVELGPHPVLAPSLRECLTARQCTGLLLPTLRRQQDERATMLSSLAELYVHGREVDWTGVFAADGRCARLPTYPWQRERHWIDPPAASSGLPVGQRTDDPLLGRRLRSARRTWETELGDDRLSYLDGHALGETTLFPGAGYVELAIAAASEITDADSIGLADLRFQTLLALTPRDDVVVQTVHDAGKSTLEIHSTTAGEDSPWTLNATARLGHATGGGELVDLAMTRRRCDAEIDVDEYYRSLAERGYRYSGAFRGISTLWHGDGEALGRIELPARSTSPDGAEGYHVHPGLLDSAFQVLLAASAAGADGRHELMVPASIARIEFRDRPGARFWAHARLAEDGTGSVHLIDESGRVALACEGLRLQPLRQRAAGRTGIDDCLYESQWQLDPLDAAAVSPDEVMRRVTPKVRWRAADEDWGSYYADFEPRLDTMAGHFARAALAELGWTGEGDQGKAAAGADEVVPGHCRYFARVAEIAGMTGPALASGSDERSAAERLADELLATHPDDRATIELVRQSGARLADVLRGRVDPREALFAGDAVETLSALYSGSGPIRHANVVLAEVLDAIASGQGTRTLRILEVGAGTGGATAAVLPRLPVGSVSYTFTDVSPYFLSLARQRFAHRPDLRFEVLDVEAGANTDGDYDVVLAADVLHATADLRTTLRNLRRRLRPGGTLVLLEVTRKTPWGDTIFGALEGWWQFTDTELRPSYPLLGVTQWQELLGQTGFTEVHAVSDVFGADSPMQAVLVAQAGVPAAAVAPKDWVIVGDKRGVAEKLAARLRAGGGDRTVVAAVPATVDEWSRLLDRHPGGLLHLGALDAPDPDQLSTGSLMEHQLALCTGIASLAQAMTATRVYPELCLVTAGAHQVGDGERRMSPTQSALWGLGRVLMNELLEVRVRLVDLSAAPLANELDGLLDELTAEPGGAELAFRGRQRYTRILRSSDIRPIARTTRPMSPDDATFRLDIDTPGQLETLILREEASAPPGPGEVTIRVHAASLNFRDVLLTLGMLSPPGVTDAASAITKPGGDCAGIVLECGPGVTTFRPGDEVVAISTGGACASRLIVDARWAVRKPPNMTYAEAASIPAAFLTAEYALHHSAGIEPRERILIHAATGGVGLAAVQVALHAGAEVFATAGSEEKRAYLRDMGIEHVLDSRSLAFADEIRARTGGQGVDVVLNSIAGEAIRAGLSVLRPYGRFVELGKRDLYDDTQVGLLPFRHNLSFSAFDLIQLCDSRPVVVERMLRDLLDRLASGELRLPPVREFDLSEAESALRFMAQARHIGKLVLTFDRPGYPVLAAREAPVFRPDATYLITGGLGGVGLALAVRMVQAGARHLVLMSRSGVPADEDRAALRALRSSPATVVVERGDVSSEQDVTRVVDRVRRELPPLRGIVHGAMVLDDGLLVDLDEQRFERVLAPKIAGAWQLHRLTLAEELDFFVLFSSLSSIIGTPMQGNYAAANAFLDGLATYRRTLGLPGLAINWGLLGEVGYVSRRPEIQQHLEREGLLCLSPDEVFDVFERSLRQNPSNTVAVRVNRSTRPDLSATSGRYVPAPATAEADGHDDSASVARRLLAAEPVAREALLVEHLVRRAARVLAMPAEHVELDRPLPELGFDSLMAVELQTALKVDLGVQLAVTKLLEGTSIREIARLALAQLAPADASSVAPAAAVEDEPAHHPLSSEQLRFWLLDQLRPGDPLSNLPTAVRLSGDLDVGALERALNEVLRRHDVLRARFAVVDGEPRQIFPPPNAVPLRVSDVAEDEVQRQVGEVARQPFDLAEGPLLRWALLRIEPTEHVLVVTAHHIAVDPWSNRVLVAEITTMYADFRAGRRPTLPTPTEKYVDYVRDQRRRLGDELLESQLAYWRGQLEGAVATIELPTDRPRPAMRTHRGGHVPFILGKDATAALTALSRAEGVTLFMTLVAGWLAFLHRCSGQDDISVGTPIMRRSAVGSDELVGCCINTLVLRGDLSGDPTFRELLHRVRAAALGAYEHQDLPFDRLVAALNPLRDGSMSPLFSTMLVLHGAMPVAELAGLRVTPVAVDNGQALFDLLLILEAGEQLGGTLEYSADLFDRDTAERLIGQFGQFLTAASGDPCRSLSEVEMPATEELDFLSGASGPVPVGLGPPRCLHELVEEQARRTPEAVAVVFEDAELTYQELDRKANRLARRLRAEGACPATVVGIGVERSLELVVAVLAVLKSGAAFLPLDPALPPARLRYLITDAQVPLVLGSRSLPVDPAVLVVLDEVLDESEDLGPPPGGANPDDTAYVIHTSGSTGAPKGVAVPHRAIVNQVRWRQAAFPLTGSDAVLQRTPVSFDPSVWELLGPLAAGATVVMPRPGSDHDSGYLAGLIAQWNVTTLQVVPSLLEALLAEPGFAKCARLRRVFCGGEPLTPALVERFFAVLSAELHNLYGPTETAIDATHWECLPGKDLSLVPIGLPIANAAVYVLDGRQRPVPVDVPGELYIGGAGVALGYLNQPELTAQRFVADPFAAGSRMYRTGDLGRRRADGAIEFLGRVDEQLKVRGMRVEPAEVEAVLTAHPGVRQAAVVARDGTRLVAFVVGATAAADALERYAADRLPPHLMPDEFVPLPELPRTGTGKVDRAMLARRQPECAPARVITPPRDALELRLVWLWQELLGTEPIGVTDDFFALGGHSLLAMRLAARIRDELGRDVSMSLLAQERTVAGLARLLAGPATLESSSLVTLQALGTRRPFFCVHPVGGGVFGYVELASALGVDRPFYALRCREDLPHARIEDMARDYLAAVRKVQPAGPYLLGGWSMGGMVAFEMAQQLSAAGERVALLAALDVWPASSEAEQAEAEEAARLSGFAREIGLSPGTMTAAEPGIGMNENRWEVLLANARAMREYVPQPYPGRVAVLAASHAADPAAKAAINRWHELATGGLDVCPVPGDHYSMLRAPHVHTLSRVLGRLLDQAR